MFQEIVWRFCGDLNDACIDLIYLDPPFNSKHNYAAPIGSKAAGAAFRDTWTLDDIDVAWIGMIADEHPDCTASLRLRIRNPTVPIWRIWPCG